MLFDAGRECQARFCLLFNVRDERQEITSDHLRGIAVADEGRQRRHDIHQPDKVSNAGTAELAIRKADHQRNVQLMLVPSDQGLIFDLGAITENASSDEATQPLPLPAAATDEQE